MEIMFGAVHLGTERREILGTVLWEKKILLLFPIRSQGIRNCVNIFKGHRDWNEKSRKPFSEKDPTKTGEKEVSANYHLDTFVSRVSTDFSWLPTELPVWLCNFCVSPASDFDSLRTNFVHHHRMAIERVHWLARSELQWERWIEKGRQGKPVKRPDNKWINGTVCVTITQKWRLYKSSPGLYELTLFRPNHLILIFSLRIMVLE